MELVYSSSLNGASFLLFELKQVVALKQEGLSSEEIRKKVQTTNIFQVENKNRMNRILPSVMKRLETIDETLANYMTEGSVEDHKALNLYAIMKTDRLFHEFMNEVIREKFELNDYVLEKKELNLFFTEKAEQSERVASWSELNIEKLKRVYLQVLIASGIVQDRTSGELNRLLINEQIKQYIDDIGDGQFIDAMGV